MAAVPSIGRASAVEPRPAGAEAQATSLLYERYSRQIFNFCLHKLGSREEAEDAAQTTFLNAFRGMQRGVRPEIEQAWLFKIAENVCLTRHRSTFRRRRVETPSDFDIVQELVPSPQRDSETLIRLPDALAEMPEQQRRALLLREWQGLSYREIAEELELSQPAVETLLFRARRSLAQGLTEAPPQKKKQRARLHSWLNLGSVLSAVKTAFAGGAAVKVAAVTAVAATTAVAGSKVEAKVQHAQVVGAAVVQATEPVSSPAVRIPVTSSAPAAAARKVAHVRRTAPTVPAHASSVPRQMPVVTAPSPASEPAARPTPAPEVETAPASAPAAEEHKPAPARTDGPKKTDRDLSAAVGKGHGKPVKNDEKGAVTRTIETVPAESVPAPAHATDSTDPSTLATGKGHGKKDAPAPVPVVDTPATAVPVPAEAEDGNGLGKGHSK